MRFCQQFATVVPAGALLRTRSEPRRSAISHSHSSKRFEFATVRDAKPLAVNRNASSNCRSSVTDWPPESLWQTYIQLTEAEAAFRIHKSELSLRPVWHQKQDRVQAHIFVCFLVYVLWKTLEHRQLRAGLGRATRTILNELGRIQSSDVALPLADGSERELRIRCVVRPDRAQVLRIERLGLELPQRLRAPTQGIKMECQLDALRRCKT